MLYGKFSSNNAKHNTYAGSHILVNMHLNYSSRNNEQVVANDIKIYSLKQSVAISCDQKRYINLLDKGCLRQGNVLSCCTMGMENGKSIPFCRLKIHINTTNKNVGLIPGVYVSFCWTK